MARTLRKGDNSTYDVVIVGAGPAGLSATLEAKRLGLRYLTIDQDDIGGTVLTYPRQKIVMTQPAVLPLYGKTRFREISKEDLLDFFRTVIGQTGVEIHRNEKLISISKNGVFELTTSKGRHTAKRVLLAIGRRGSPRKLGVPGEDSAKVTYALTEPEQYRRSKVLVVGGGDSAVEAATALAEEKGTDVTLSYRGNAFSRVKPKNRARIDQAAEADRVRVLLESQVERIDAESVTLRVGDRATALPNDYVLVFAGGELPTALLKSVGIQVDTKFGER
jgi:putative YpdA family bacillithiol system oxidoreductase